MNLAVRQTSTGYHRSVPDAPTNVLVQQQQPTLPAKPPKALPPPPTTSTHFPSNDQLVASNRLKQQNRQLSDEVTLKSQRIAALERERQTLVRELVASQRAAASLAAQQKQQQQHIAHNNNLSNISDEVIF